MTDGLFRDRREAGRVLASLLGKYRGRDDVVILALPGGGVPVAYEVAKALGAPLDVFVVRKLGVPGYEELAMGAIASGGVVVLEDDIIRAIDVPPDIVESIVVREARELYRRERLYRGDRPFPAVEGKIVILVDDGLATGSSMRAAIQAVRRLRPAGIVVAVPAASASTCEQLASEVDEVVCATTPSPFTAVGASYWDFTQVSDDEVISLLRAARSAAGLQRSGTAPAADVDVVRSELVPLPGGERDYDSLLEAVGDAHFVLLGEASYGTHEFYAERAAITRRLIREKGFCAVAVEGDWPDAYRVNRFVRGQTTDVTAEEALRGFERFPTWMWRNAVVVDFVGWLREWNDRAGVDDRRKAGFYGLDLYGLFLSIHEVIAYLERVDRDAAARGPGPLRLLRPFQQRRPGLRLRGAFGAGDSCESEAVAALTELRREVLERARTEGLAGDEELFDVEQNAETVKAAEEYYRTMFTGDVSSWNLRDRHMTDTLDRLAAHLTRRRGEDARIVVWAHSSHLGDARATEIGMRGELNVGQLVRERHAADCLSVGFTTHAGTVTAAEDWGQPAERKQVRPSLEGSIERLFHEVGTERFLLRFGAAPNSAEVLGSARLERAIGVIYRPRSERQSHYFRARLADQFDAVIHIDDTRAVEPLERTPLWESGDVPEILPAHGVASRSLRALCGGPTTPNVHFRLTQA